MALRAETAAAHAALDQQIGALTSRSAYIAYARGLHAFRAPLEDALAAYGPYGAWRPLRLTPLLAADLADLDAAPQPPAPTPLDSPCEAVGALYVLEGSALGARVLKVMAQDLGLTGACGARHLHRQAESLENWRAFLAFLEHAPALNMARAVQGACAAFDAAARAMSRAVAYA